MKNKFLTEEIVLHIFSYFGFSKKVKKSAGILDKDFLLDKTVKINIDNEEINFLTYGAKIDIDNESKLIIFGADLSLDDDIDFNLLFKFDEDSRFYLLYREFDDEIEVKFNVKNKEWQEASLSQQCRILSSFEDLFNFGMTFEPYKDIDDLFSEFLKLNS